MGTRATYEFRFDASYGKGVPHKPVTFYIHHDGYEAGAAMYLWNAHHCANRHGNMADRFLRANERAALTASAEAHGDLEYTYVIEGDNLTARKRPGWREEHDDCKSWPVVFYGKWWDFVNKHPELIENFSPLASLPDLYAYAGNHRVARPYSRTELLALAADAERRAEEYKARFPQFTGNIAGMAAEVKRIADLLEQYRVATEPKAVA